MQLFLEMEGAVTQLKPGALEKGLHHTHPRTYTLFKKFFIKKLIRILISALLKAYLL